MTILDDLPNPPEVRPGRADADKLVLGAAMAQHRRHKRVTRGMPAHLGTRLALAGVVAVAVVLIVGALALPSPTNSSNPASRTRTPSAAPTWRLVGDFAPSWRTAPGLGYQPGVSLVCPTTTTCYALNLEPGRTYSEVELTHDGGTTWQPSDLPVALSGASPLTCVDADTCATLGIDESGDATLLETTNGGESWAAAAGPTQLSSPIDVTVLACTTAESCRAVVSDPGGQSGTAVAFATNDGGDTWTDSALPADFVPGGLQCSSTDRCVVSGFFQSPDGSSTAPAGTLLYSTDDGISWVMPALPSDLGALSSLSCADSADCVASFFGDDGSSSEILTSSDGGASWLAARASGLPAAMVTALACPTASQCWASGLARVPGGTSGAGSIAAKLGPGAEGIVASTADNGQTWQAQQLPPGVLIVFDLSCPSGTTCYAMAVQRRSPGSQPSFVLLTDGS